jgi:hypothetical protein
MCLDKVAVASAAMEAALDERSKVRKSSVSISASPTAFLWCG